MDETFTLNHDELTPTKEWSDNIRRVFQAERQNPSATTLRNLFGYAAAIESVQSDLIGNMEIMKN